MCDNPSTNDDGDHNQPDKLSNREVEVEWKPNRLFAHNPRPKTWHRFMAGESERVNLTIFFADPDKIRSHRTDFDYFIDCDQTNTSYKRRGRVVCHKTSMLHS